MPLHRSGLVSRHALEHPDEEPQEESLPYERVLKYNPNHGPDGRFTSGGGGRRGGTAGPPTEDAFGRPIKGGGRRDAGLSAEAQARAGNWRMREVNLPAARGQAGVTRARTGLDDKDLQRASHEAALRHGYDSKEHVAAEIALGSSPHAMRVATIPGAITGRTPAVAPYTITDTSNDKSPYTIRDESNDTGFSRGGPPVTDPNFHRGGPPVKDPKFHIENPALPGFRFSNEQRRRHAKEMFGSVGERAEIYRQSGLPSYEAKYRAKLYYGTSARERSKATSPSVRGSLKPRRSSFS